MNRMRFVWNLSDMRTRQEGIGSSIALRKRCVRSQQTTGRRAKWERVRVRVRNVQGLKSDGLISMYKGFS